MWLNRNRSVHLKRRSDVMATKKNNEAATNAAMGCVFPVCCLSGLSESGWRVGASCGCSSCVWQRPSIVDACV